MREKLQRFYSEIKRLDDWHYLNYRLKYELAPVIEGIKPASTINLTMYKEQISHCQDNIFMPLGLEYMALRSHTKLYIILVYKRQLLEKLLAEQGINVFLESLGYPPNRGENNTVEKALIHLKERYTEYHCPHELGVFLGIPLEEVKGFIDCKDKKCLLCGYWKVYHDIQYAKKIFSQYDEAKNQMLSFLLGEIEYLNRK